ncbi:MAG: MFS transporter [Candidatus Dormibacteria bacterium]
MTSSPALPSTEAGALTAAVVTVAAPPPLPLPPAASLRLWPPPSLRVRAFRWYWIAQWPALLGTWMQIVALGWLVYDRTHSSTAVAAVAAADGVPTVLLSLLGGVLADRWPRRRILIATQSVLGLSSGTLAVLAFTGHAGFWSIFAVAAVYGSADALDLPTRQALVTDLVDREVVVNAMALTSTAMGATRIVGPSLAGVLIATAGPGACFLALSLAYLGPLAVLLTVIPDIHPLRRGTTALADLVAGLGTVRRDPLVRGIVIIGAALAFFGVAYMPYLPVLGRTRLGGGPAVLGLLYSVGGIGGVAGGLLIAAVGTSARRRQLLVIGGVAYAASLFTLAHSTVLALSLVALVGISFSFLAVNTSLMTLLQTDVDPGLRGRLLGIYAMTFGGLQPLGTVMYAGLAGVTGLFAGIGDGALVVGAATVLVALSPSFRGHFAPGRVDEAPA